MVALFHLDVLSHVWGMPLVRNAYLFVDFFFVLSGFVISHAYGARLSTPGEFGQFMVRRFGRVWPLHGVVLLAFIGLELAKLGISHASGIVAGEAPFDPHGRASLAHLPSNLLLLHALGFDDRLTWNLPSWSISAEFWTYVVFGTVSLAVPKMRNAALGGLALVSFAVLVTRASHGMDATFDLGFPRAVLGFALGHFVYVLRLRCLEFRPATLAALEWAALALSLTFVILAGKGPLSFAAPFIFAISVYVFSFEAGPVSKVLVRAPFRNLGLWSYSIYMVHDFAAYALSLALSMAEKRFGLRLWQEVSVHGDLTRAADLGSVYANDALTIAYLGIVIALSALTYRAVEQPGRRAFNRLAVNLAARQAAA
jgi:peptidoglycan/LPS O-acetylase OafA/YrhL